MSSVGPQAGGLTALLSLPAPRAFTHGSGWACGFADEMGRYLGGSAVGSGTEQMLKNTCRV